MADLPGLPSEVPQEYRDQLVKFQKQIKILINNHQILESRSLKNPQDQKVLKQIDEVKNYLISFSDQQREVLDKVRTYLRILEEERKVDIHELGPPAIPLKKEHKTSRCSTPVKNHKNKAKKKGKGKSSKNSSSASPDSSDEECDEIFLTYFNPTEGYRGHVEEYDIECPPTDETDDLIEEKESEEFTFPRAGNQPNIDEKGSFMLNIDLLTESQYKMSVTSLDNNKRRKARKRVTTYIPEVADKKYRYQTFLQNSITSPPHLRRRKANQLPSIPRPVKSLSFPTVDKMETRNKSPSLSKSQIDGANDISDSDTDDAEESVAFQSVEERIELRNSLLKRKREMESQMDKLQKKANLLQEKREVQKEDRCLLMKHQNETEEKIRHLHQFVSKHCYSTAVL